jgi:hypothetical protein
VRRKRPQHDAGADPARGELDVVRIVGEIADEVHAGLGGAKSDRARESTPSRTQ